MSAIAGRKQSPKLLFWVVLDVERRKSAPHLSADICCMLAELLNRPMPTVRLCIVGSIGAGLPTDIIFKCLFAVGVMRSLTVA